MRLVNHMTHYISIFPSQGKKIPGMKGTEKQIQMISIHYFAGKGGKKSIWALVLDEKIDQGIPKLFSGKNEHICTKFYYHKPYC